MAPDKHKGPTVDLAAGFPVGDDLYVVWVDIASLREQDMNAQVMQPRDFDRLTENIRNRGALEQLPYCHLPDPYAPVEIISGHHRVRAARSAGLTRIAVLLDVRPMARSQVVAKQIAHNVLHGVQDPQILQQLLELVTDVDDLLATGLAVDALPSVEPDDTVLRGPAADFDWRLLTMAFLPAQMTEFGHLVKMVDSSSDMIGLAPGQQFHPFATALQAFGGAANVTSVAMTVSLLTELALREAAELELAADEQSVRVATLFGAGMPAEAASTVTAALEKMTAAGVVSPEQPWRALELWAAQYLTS